MGVRRLVPRLTCGSQLRTRLEKCPQHSRIGRRILIHGLVEMLDYFGDHYHVVLSYVRAP